VETYEIFPLRTETLPPATHTNCYILGTATRWVVDPGSPFPEEQTRLLEHLEQGAPVAGIVLTHRHRDHISGAQDLADALGCSIWAHPITAGEVVDKVEVDKLLEDGDALALGGGAELKVLHTPGHAQGHICLWAPNAHWLLCGDMVAGVGSILIAPPDGDVRDYLASLERLRTLEPQQLLPAHGPVIDAAVEKLGEYIAHRLQREQQVLAALSGEWKSIDAIVPLAYVNTPKTMWPYAAGATLAHLQKLVDDEKAVEHDGRYRLARE
jgi:glyoxylase-like metal-dependent hydrolase (beta-lactamase superfamily II)